MGFPSSETASENESSDHLLSVSSSSVCMFLLSRSITQQYGYVSAKVSVMLAAGEQKWGCFRDTHHPHVHLHYIFMGRSYNAYMYVFLFLLLLVKHLVKCTCHPHMQLYRIRLNFIIYRKDVNGFLNYKYAHLLSATARSKKEVVFNLISQIIPSH